MGVQGFKTYILSNAEELLESFNLSKSSLVIDGECLIHQFHGRFVEGIYINKYQNFQKKVSKFLDELLDCTVTPIIVFRGGKEVQKLSKDSKEFKENVLKLELDIKKKKVTQLPTLLEEIVKYVAKEKNIIFVQSLFKTEFDIVSIAKILNCPIISDVNTFYLHNVMFIPFFDEFKKIKIGDNFEFCCKIFKTEKILEYFLDQRVVSVAKIVLNSSSKETKTFVNFFSSLKLDDGIPSRSVRRVQAVLSWFKFHTLDTAIDEILKFVDHTYYHNVIKDFENAVYEHEHISPRLFAQIGIPEEAVNDLILKFKRPESRYKYSSSKNIESLDRNFEGVLTFNDKEIKLEQILNKTVLSWFVDEFYSGKYPSYFIDIYFRRLYIPPVQMENIYYNSCINISLHIIGVIFKLLVEDSNILIYASREKNGTDIQIHELNVKQIRYDFEIPSLEYLKSTSIEKKRIILVKTLKISQDHLSDFPKEWALFIGAIIYWFKNSENVFTEKCYLLALILSMINSITVKDIKNKNSKLISKREIVNSSTELTIKNYFENFTKNDCISIQQASKYILKTKVFFELNKIHAFSLFENCFKHIIHLNTLLDYPYPSPNIAKIFDGKIVDHLCHYLKNKRYPEEDIKIIYKNSPAFLNLFEAILIKFDSMIK